jgi:SAM-dependent methyltransferase
LDDKLARRARDVGLDDEDIEAWHRSGLPASALDQWVTDRIARRPTGARARLVYGGETIHDFARRAILDALKLGPRDRLLDIGCGGGLLLRDALKSGAAAAGLDHSPDMVEVAQQRAPGATVVLGDAEQLPFPDSTFTCVSMSIVFFFLDAPVRVLEECRRVLVPGGRLAIYTTAPELRGTPAAPEPVASLAHWYSDNELADLATRAGFREVNVQRPSSDDTLEEGPGGAQLVTAHR